MASTPRKSDIATLISTFTSMSGFQLSNRFAVTITPPDGVSSPTIPIFATTIQTPSQAIVYEPDNMSPSGPSIMVPIKRSYDDRFIIEFIVDGNWEIRKFFDDWMNWMFISTNPTTVNSTNVRYWDEIVGTVVIEALKRNDETAKTLTLYDAYPKTIIPTQMSNDTPNQYLTLMVDMNYRYYKLT